MSRTVELGRAVLSSGNSSIQLWLTTLITVLPSSDATNLQLLNDTALINHLASGVLWVRRGNGMVLLLEVTDQNRTLDGAQMDRLKKSILNAPAWKQLGLRVSLPPSEAGLSPEEDSQDYLRCTVDHCRLTAPEPSLSRHHRIGEDVHSADTQPPGLVPAIALERVHHKMTFLRQATSRGRVTRASPRKKMYLESPGDEQVEENGVPMPEGHSNLEIAQLLTPEPSQGLQTPNESQQDGDISLSGEDHDHGQPRSTTQLQTPVQESRKRKRNLTSQSSSGIAKRDHLLFSDIEKLIDAAMRLSASKSAPRLPHGVKIVTQTFAKGLSDVCPSVWSPHFLPALSHRTHLLPTISRSLLKATGPTARSESLKKRMNYATQYGREQYETWCDAICSTNESGNIDGSIQARLWVHMQKKLLAKAVKPHEAFCSYRRSPSPEQGSDDMLEEVWKPGSPDEPCETNEHLVYGLATPFSEPDELFGSDMVLDTGSPLLELERSPDPSHPWAHNGAIHSDDILEPDNGHPEYDISDEQGEPSYHDIDEDLHEFASTIVEQTDFDESLHNDPVMHTPVPEQDEEERQLYASVPTEQCEDEDFSASISTARGHLQNANTTLFEDISQRCHENTWSDDVLPGDTYEGHMEVDG